MKKILTFSIGALLIISCLSCTKNPPTEKRINKYGFYAETEDLVCDKIRQKTLSETDNDFHIGCEALDRGYSDYNSYKAYLQPLGIKYIRLQAGWARCEKEAGVYDFGWLDEIIDDAVSKGLEPWLQTSYGNPLYKGGGNSYSSSAIPTSAEALAAWDQWVTALAERYKDKVHVYEVWNEPDLRIADGTNSINDVIGLNIRTAEAIKSVNPEAQVAALALAKADATIVQQFMEGVKKAGKNGLFDYITYHAYSYIPEQSQVEAERLRNTMSAYGSKIKLWHGESGAPSKGHLSGALSDYDWSEISQAKWALRNMISDKAYGIRTGIYTIAENNYSAGKNTKGLLETDLSNRVVRAKQVYSSVRNLVSINELLNTPIPNGKVRVCTDEEAVKYLFSSGKDGYAAVIWKGGSIPDDSETADPVSVSIVGFRFNDPAAVDIRSGKIIKLEHYETDSFQTIYGVPFYDSPILITDYSSVR